MINGFLLNSDLEIYNFVKMKNLKNIFSFLCLILSFLSLSNQLNNNEKEKIISDLTKKLTALAPPDLTTPLSTLIEAGIFEDCLDQVPFHFVQSPGKVISVNHAFTSFAFGAKVDLNKDGSVIVDAVVRVIMDSHNWGLFTGNLNWARISGQKIDSEDEDDNPDDTFTYVNLGESALVHSFGGTDQDNNDGTAQLYELHKVSFFTEDYKFKEQPDKENVNLLIQISEFRTGDLRNPIFSDDSEEGKVKNTEGVYHLLTHLIKSVQQCKAHNILHGDIRPGTMGLNMGVFANNLEQVTAKLTNFGYSVLNSNQDRLFPSSEIDSQDSIYENVDLIVTEKYKEDYRLPISTTNVYDKLKSDSKIKERFSNQVAFPILKNSLNDYFALSISARNIVQINQAFLNVETSKKLVDLLEIFEEIISLGTPNEGMSLEEFLKERVEPLNTAVAKLEEQGGQPGKKILGNVETNKLLEDKQLDFEKIEDRFSNVLMESVDDESESGDDSGEVETELKNLEKYDQIFAQDEDPDTSHQIKLEFSDELLKKSFGLKIQEILLIL
jgi:hypothetical protein